MATTTRFDEMCEIEPELRALQQEAQAVEGGGDAFCANEAWYAELKPQVEKLAGWGARNEALRTSGDYEAACQAVYDQLPECGPMCPCL